MMGGGGRWWRWWVFPGPQMVWSTLAYNVCRRYVCVHTRVCVKEREIIWACLCMCVRVCALADV